MAKRCGISPTKDYNVARCTSLSNFPPHVAESYYQSGECRWNQKDKKCTLTSLELKRRRKFRERKRRKARDSQQKPTKPRKPTKPTKTTKPTKSTKPTKPTKPTKLSYMLPIMAAAPTIAVPSLPIVDWTVQKDWGVGLELSDVLEDSPDDVDATNETTDSDSEDFTLSSGDDANIDTMADVLDEEEQSMPSVDFWKQLNELSDNSNETVDPEEETNEVDDFIYTAIVEEDQSPLTDTTTKSIVDIPKLIQDVNNDVEATIATSTDTDEIFDMSFLTDNALASPQQNIDKEILIGSIDDTLHAQANDDDDDDGDDDDLFLDIEPDEPGKAISDSVQIGTVEDNNTTLNISDSGSDSDETCSSISSQTSPAKRSRTLSKLEPWKTTTQH